MRSGSAAINRRAFVGLGGAAALALSVSPSACARDDRPRRKAKNLIFMVSDGMSFGTLSLADTLVRQKTSQPCNWIQWMQREGVSRSLIATRSADSLVTDSAAASAAWSIGELVDNGRLGLTPDGRMPTPILMHAKQSGRAVGVVTTARICHATPAGFVCNVPTNRDDENGISEQMLARGLDLMLGGGGRFFSPDLLKASGFKGAVVRNRTEFLALDLAKQAAPVAGIFNDSHMSFELDRVNGSGGPANPREPSLSEMTAYALKSLDRHPGGFAMQIEGGRVDHGGHTNDAGALIYDQVAFDEAIGVVWEFVKNRDDTLVIMTADHATANPGLTEYNDASIRGFEKVHGFKHTYAWIDRQLGGESSLEASEPAEIPGQPQAMSPAKKIAPDRVREVILAATGIELDSTEVELLRKWKAGEVVDPYRTNNFRYAPLAAVLANHTAIAFLSPNHTSDPVELTAWGPGSESMPETMAINQIHEVMVKGLDLAPAKPA